MLKCLRIDASIECERLGGSLFFTFSCRELNQSELQALSRHSAFSFIAERQKDWLRPLSFPEAAFLPADLPEVLKYKGKTNVAFTRMMINTARSLLPDGILRSPLTLLDPLCGKGTSLFCAALDGLNAVGLDRDQHAVKEGADYFSRYLKYHRMKHTTVTRSETLKHGSVSVTEYTYSGSKEQYLAGDTRKLLFGTGDTVSAPALMRKNKADLIIADLPYGVQHAPVQGTKPESFTSLLSRALPAWKQALKPGGSVALSFNTYTLPAHQVHQLLQDAGLTPLADDPYLSLKHEVDQAVVRDVLFAINTEGGPSHEYE